MAEIEPLGRTCTVQYRSDQPGQEGKAHPQRLRNAKFPSEQQRLKPIRRVSKTPFLARTKLRIKRRKRT